jgi:hypothetical protein
MTIQENTGRMPALEGWVRQLYGELIPSQVANIKAKQLDIHKNYVVYLRATGVVGLFSQTRKNMTRVCNVEFTFDGDTYKFKNIKIIDTRLLGSPLKDDDIIRPYVVFLRSVGTVGVCSLNNRNRNRACNVEFTFDRETLNLKAVRIINGGNDES